MTEDKNKGITLISYNHLNMPTEVKFNNSDTQKINYTYSADGIKLQKSTNDNGNVTTTKYAGNFVYENDILKQFNQPEGYVEPDGNSYQYVYRYTDIWGNTRITYADDDASGDIDPTTEIRREQNYYPFGLEHKGYNSNLVGTKNNLKTYQKQEFTEDLGLNTHEWKYRMSDPAIGRFWQVDPLAEKYSYNSTYAFQENKLGSGIELEGLENLDWLKNKLIVNAATNPNGVSAHVVGGTKGLYNSGVGAYEAITNPRQTLNGLANLGVAAMSNGNPLYMTQLDQQLGTESLSTSVAIKEGVENSIDAVKNGNGIERGQVFGEVLGAVFGSKGVGVLGKTVSTAIKANKTTTLFRAVSGSELNDISSNGLRNISGQYETGKLFTNSAENASQFGQWNFKADGIPNTIIGVKVPNSIMKNATFFTTDGLPAVSIPTNQLNKIKNIKPLNHSPITNN